MNKGFRSFVLAVTILWLISVIMAGCGILPFGTGGQKPTVAREGALTLVGDDPPTLDPALSSDSTSSRYIVEVFSGLVTLSPKLEIIPDVAERWDVSSDGKTYTFHLRKGVKFHDGKEVKAGDFKYSIERAADPNTGSAVADTYLGDIIGVREVLKGERKQVSGVKVVDDSTLQITIDGAKVYFLAKMTYPTAFVLDQANVESSRNWTDKPNGTGPFKLQEYKRGERIVLARNPDFYRGAAKLERVNFLLAGGSSMTMYENNEIDVTGVGIVDIERVSDPNNPLSKELKVSPQMGIFYVGLNNTRAPFDDVKVRQAFSYAVDKDAIANVVYKKMVEKANGILPPGMPGYNPNLKGYPFDPDKAKQLLAESKYKGASGLPPMTLSTVGAGGTAASPVTALQEMWKKNLGVEVQIQQVEWATYLDDLKKKRFHMFGGVSGWIADYPDPQDFLDILFHSGSLDNNMAYSNRQADALLEKARSEQNVDVRLKMYQEIEQMILNDAPIIPLHFDRSYVLVKPYVEGYIVPATVVPFMKDVSIKPR
ncbi:MAG: peptide ABC transporter substrate-binding protein [Chloroflexi bacterium]|nr:peptide ABC transporter substrate-binding protein [Chloroflexota bacterium]